MPRLAPEQLTFAESDTLQSVPEDETDNDNGAEGFAGIINSASLSSSAQKDKGALATEKEAGGARLSGFYKIVSGMLQMGGQKPMTTADESNISKKRATFETVDHEAAARTTAEKVGIASNRTSLPRPSIIFADIGKGVSNGRPDPYVFEVSPQKPISSAQSDPKLAAKQQGRNPQNSGPGMGKSFDTIHGQPLVDTEDPEVTEEAIPGEDFNKLADGNISKRKRPRSPSAAEAGPSPKRVTRSGASVNLGVPTNYSVRGERGAHTRNLEEQEALVSVELVKAKRKPGRPRKQNAHAENDGMVNTEIQVESLSSPARTIDSHEDIALTTGALVSGLPGTAEGNMSPDLGNGESIFVEEENSGKTQGGSEVLYEISENGDTSLAINPSPTKPSGSRTTKKRPNLIPKNTGPTRRSNAEKDHAEMLSKSSPKMPKNWAQKRRKRKSSDSPENKKKTRKPIGNRQIENKEDNKRAMEERQEQMRTKNTHFNQQRELLQKVASSSQENQVRARSQQQPPLPNSSQIRAPSSSQLPHTPPNNSVQGPISNRSPFVHPIQKWKEEYEKQLKERTKQMQQRNKVFKQNRELLELVPIYNPQRTEYFSSSQLLSSQFSNPQQFSGPGYEESDLPPTSSLARQIQRELAALAEQDRLIAEKRARLQRGLRAAKEEQARSGQTFDADERVHMFGGGKSPATKPKKWSREEMAILIEGLRANQGLSIPPFPQ